MKFLRVAVALLLFAGVEFASSTGLFAQEPSPEPMTVAVDSGEEEITVTSEETSEQAMVPTVKVLSDQALAITLQFPNAKVGAPVLICTYDGGAISGIDNPVVPGDGAVPFTFQPGAAPGAYRVMVQVGDEQHLLQFHVNPPTQ
jgi:hypothetical protein